MAAASGCKTWPPKNGRRLRIVPQNSSVTIVSATLANNGGYGLFDDVYGIHRL